MEYVVTFPFTFKENVYTVTGVITDLPNRQYDLSVNNDFIQAQYGYSHFFDSDFTHRIPPNPGGKEFIEALLATLKKYLLEND
jgi:hypothetical protein